MNIEALEADVKSCESALREAVRLREIAWIAESPYQVGDVIEARRPRRDWEPARVARVDPGWRGYFTYQVSFKKKDGEWGEPRRMWDGSMRLAEIASRQGS